MKRKPDKVVVHRIELQHKERDLVEQWIYLDSLTRIFGSLSTMSYGELYAWITVLESFGLVDTPIPTVADKDEIPAALAAWARAMKKTGSIFERLLRTYHPNLFNANPFDNI